MGDDTEWLKLPTDEKCQHKAWKARIAGYEEAIKLFQTLGDEKSPEFMKYLGLIKKFVIDNNAIAQEKGLEATLAFVENAAQAGKTAGEVCGGIITKCLNQRAKAKDLGVAILMAYIEAEKQEIVQDELMKGLTNKQPKIVAVCVSALREALRDFGTKIISVKPILKTLQALLEDRDKAVREEAKLLVVEIYRWIGQALKPHLANLKPVQLTELEAEFEKLPPSKPQQARFLRSQQDLKAKMLEQAAAAGDEAATEDVSDGPAAAPDIDPYDLIDPVDIISKLPKDFYEKVEEKKWQERREALEAVQKLADTPKIEQGDFNDLMRALRKVVAKDTNIMLVTIAAKCIALIANGLRKKFSQHSVACLEVLIEKFREKKISVVQVLREAIDACFVSTTLEAIGEVCVASLDHKTPSVKAETASFLARCFSQCTPVTLPKKVLKIYIAPLLKAVNDSAGEVREAAFDALGTAMKVITEKAIMPFLPDVDNLKMAKIKECCEKAVVVGKGGGAKGPSGDSGGVAAKPAAPAAQKASAAPAKKESAKAPAKKASDPGQSAPSSSAGAKKKPAGKGKKPAADGKEERLEPELPEEVVEEKMSALFPGGSLAGLDNANWKERLGAVEKMLEVVKGMCKEDIPTQAFVRTVSKKPGFKETNFQVLKLKVDLVTHLALNSSFSKRSAEYCLNDLMDKIGDAKNGMHVQEALSAIAEATSLDFIALQVIQFAFEQKNPKNQSESLNWLATAIKQFGFKVTVKPLVEVIGKALAATNPAVRTSAITLLGIMYMYMGATLRVFFENEKPALLQQIDAEFEKVKGERPPPPTRGVQPTEEAAEDAEDVEDGAGGDAGSGINIADLVPRTDISERITDALISELDDKNWKVRKEALEKVQSILNEAKFITANIGQLPEALKKRLGDSNKILVSTTLAICQTLATAMGPSIKQHVGTVGGGLISNFGDSKPGVRQQAVAALNAWVEHTGLLIFVEAQIFSDNLKLENPNLRAELLGWLAEKLPPCKKLPAELQECIPHLFACMEDRNADVRKKAQEALLPFMIHTGYDAMVRHAGKLKPASKDPVLKALEAARQNLPQKPAKAPAASQPTVKGGGGKPKAAPVKADYDDEEPEDTGSRPPSTASSKTGAGAAGKGKAKPNGSAGGGAAASGGAAAANKKGAAAASGAGGASKKKGQDEEDSGPPLRASNGKDQRIKDEKNLKVFKWNFAAPRPEFIDQLRQQMEPTFSRTLLDQLFHADFKFHIKAMDTLIKLCETDPDATIANLDLLLKWLTLRFFDTNTTVLMKALEYLQAIFALLATREYYLLEIEAVSFIPYLINKVGDPKDNIRRDVRNIIQMICRVYAGSKVFTYLLDGLKSKNAKQRTECLEELGNLISFYGIEVCQPSPAAALRLIAQQISDRDNSVRSSALNAIVSAHSILGDNVFKHIGLLNEKDQSMLDERIKRSAKTRPPGAVPGNMAAPPAQQNARMSPEEKPRPTTKMAAPASTRPASDNRNMGSAAMRSKGQFQLDIEEIDATENYSMPELIEPDLTEILDEPVTLPRTRMRPPSPSIKLLHNSADAKSAVDLVISQVASSDMLTSLQALQQIDEVLKDSEKSEALHQHIDHLLTACTLQLRVAYTKHMSDNASSREVVRLYRCILATLISLCKCSSLVREATCDVLKNLVSILVTVLLDNRLNGLDEGAEVIRAVNVTVVKFVEHADVTNVMCALIKLLHETVDIETCSPQFLELVMKCLWKMVRMLPKIINDLDLDQVVFHTHLFLKAFPSHTWKAKMAKSDKSTDMPLRTMKTILHSLATIRGNKILSHMTLIEPGDHSEVESYLRKVLRTSSDTESVSTANSRNEQLNGNLDRADGMESGQKSPRRISRTVHETLAEIFKKIGSKENTREGLNNLYDFKLKHPDADIDPFLKKSSQFFQNYIERGLETIAQEREGKLKASSCPSAADVTSNAPTTQLSSNATDVSAAEYRERLKAMLARCGLDSAQLISEPKQRTDSASSSDSIGVRTDASSQLPTNPQSRAPVSNAPSAPTDTVSNANLNLEEMKKRLEKIKAGQKD